MLEAIEKVWWKTLLSIAYGSGLRRDEIFNLTWQDIDFENKLVYINAKQPDKLLLEWEPKDHHNRMVPLTEQTIKLLAEMQLSAPAGHSNISTTRKYYLAVRDEDIASANQIFNKILESVKHD